MNTQGVYGRLMYSPKWRRDSFSNKTKLVYSPDYDYITVLKYL